MTKHQTAVVILAAMHERITGKPWGPTASLAVTPRLTMLAKVSADGQLELSSEVDDIGGAEAIDWKRRVEIVLRSGKVQENWSCRSVGERELLEILHLVMREAMAVQP